MLAYLRGRSGGRIATVTYHSVMRAFTEMTYKLGLIGRRTKDAPTFAA